MASLMHRRGRIQTKNTSRFHKETQRNLGGRHQQVVPVGAWVELAPVWPYLGDEAIVSAELEEQRIRRKQIDKEAKLRHFQTEVRKRVQRLQRIKRAQQLENSYKAVELERTIVHQTVHAAEKHTPRQNRCLYRSVEKHAIGSDLATSESEIEEDDESVKRFQEHSENIHRVISRAKRNLADKQMFLEKHSLPGGGWGVSVARDKPAAEFRIAEACPHPQTYVEPEISNQQLREHLHSEEILQLAGVSPPRIVTFNDNLGKASVVQSNVIAQPRKVTFDTNVYMVEGQGDRPLTKKGWEGKDLSRKIQVPDVNPGKKHEDDKQLMLTQFSMYRRLFMDIEREQVRENMRRKQHAEKINRIKREKEQQRQKEEQEARAAVESRHPLTGETEEEARTRQREEERHVADIMEIHRKRKQKNKETERFIEALRSTMREKIEKLGIHLPPLCACSATLWDSSPDTCANNCMFYRNPKAYAKALSSLLQSCEIA